MLIAIDIGTTNVKAVAVGAAGDVLAKADRENHTLNPRPSWQEQDPEQVFRLVTEVLAEVWTAVKDREILRGVIFSSAMHGLIAMNDLDKPLTNILLWSDTRANDIATALRNTEKGMRLYRQTGVPIHAMNPLCKMVWLRTHHPDIFGQTSWFADVKSYIWCRLTGERTSDISVASANGWLNIDSTQPDETALECTGLSAAQLPEPVSPAHSAFLKPEMAKLYGLPVNVPYLIGASDGAFANLGSNATLAGQIAVTIGTSAAIRTVSGTALLDDRMRTFCYRLDENRWIVGGASNNGTNAMEWLRQSVFRSPLSAAAFADQAKEVPPGADDLLFLPYLLGERAPLYNAHATGSFQGLTVRHTQAHFVRATMEGVIFNLKMIGEALETHISMDTLHAGGGFSRNRMWVQMLADVFQKTVILSDTETDASLLGAIHYAAQVLETNLQMKKSASTVIEPNRQHTSLYQEVYARFKALTLNSI